MPDLQMNPLGLLDKAALEYLKSKKLLPGFSHYDVWMHEYSVAFTVAKMLDADLLQEVKSALEEAIESGTDFNTFKKRLKPYLMARGWWGEQIMLDPVDGIEKVVQLGSTRRLETIFQTNMATAYAAGQWQRIQSTKAALPYLRYNASAASNPREAHKRYYGLVLPVGHKLWKQIFPPNGYGCLCSVSQLTRGQAERYGISEEPEEITEEFTNPRTGEVATIAADITPGFAHNHGDRQGALEALFGERHGAAALDDMIQAREAYLSQRYTMPSLNQVSYAGLKADAAEVKRLLVDPLDKQPKISEAIAAVLWQAAYKIELKRYAGPSITPPDFIVTSEGGVIASQSTIDFMYTMDGIPDYKLQKFNEYFANTPQAWAAQKINIQKHIAKADVVPLDLRQLNALNRLKLLNYVLSLPKEQSDKIVFILGENQ